MVENVFWCAVTQGAKFILAKARYSGIVVYNTGASANHKKKCLQTVLHVRNAQQNVFCGKFCQLEYHYMGLSGYGDTIVGLEAADGTRIQITVDDARKMQTIENLLEDAGTEDYIPLPNIDGATLLRIQHFLNRNYDSMHPMTDEEFFKLLMAANYLDFPDLLYYMYPEWVNLRPFPGPRELQLLIPDAVFFSKGANILNLHIPTDLILSAHYFITDYGKDDWVFALGVRKNKRNIIREMLLETIDVKTRNTLAIVLAANNGQLQVVKLLANNFQLSNDWVDEALRYAAMDGHVDVVDFLTPMLDDTENDLWNQVIQNALFNYSGRLDVMIRLLQDERFEIDEDTIESIAESVNLEILRLFLQDGRIDPSKSRNLILRLAAQYGKLDIVEFLLSSYKDIVNPADADNYAIITAAENRHLDVVDRLLQDPRVDPTANDNDAIRSAARNGHYQVVERLLQDERVNVEALCPFITDERICELYDRYKQKRQRVQSMYK